MYEPGAIVSVVSVFLRAGLSSSDTSVPSANCRHCQPSESCPAVLTALALVEIQGYFPVI